MLPSPVRSAFLAAALPEGVPGVPPGDLSASSADDRLEAVSLEEAATSRAREVNFGDRGGGGGGVRKPNLCSHGSALGGWSEREATIASTGGGGE